MVTSNLNNLKVFAFTYFSYLNAINTSDSGIDNLKRRIKYLNWYLEMNQNHFLTSRVFVSSTFE